jgi:asparagine synthase (glutamine-hydrolysing)
LPRHEVDRVSHRFALWRAIHPPRLLAPYAIAFLLRSPAVIESPRASFWGWIDLDVLDVESALEDAQQAGSGELREITSAGLRCSARRRDVRVVAVDGGFALVAGQPRVANGRAVATDRQIAEALKSISDGASDEPFSGRFSIVYLDRRRRCLNLLTDRFGVHPICYAVEGGRFAFSDRGDAVLTREPTSIDPQALFNYAYFHVLPAPRTAFRGVLRMEPAHLLRFSVRGLQLAATWKPRFVSAGRKSDEPTYAEFLELIRAAVTREAEGQLTGAFLSGGTDSSTVAGMLRAVTGRAPEVFSIGFEAEGYDEIEFAKIAVRHFDCHHNVYYVTPNDVIAAVPEIAGQYDQPFGNSSALPAYYCARLARETGIGKLLAGDGGDELFGGNTRYAKQKVFEAYSAALPAALRRALIEPVFLSASVRAAPGLRKVSSYVAQARIPMPERTETYNLLHRHGVANLFTPRLVEAVDAGEPESLQRRVYAESLGAAVVDRMLAYDWRFTLADNDLPKVVGSGALARVDVGFPLLDDSLVDLSLRLTASQKVRGLTLRHWFKQALGGFLPDEIIRKKKHGFGLPFGPWLVKHPALQRLARESIGGLVDRGLIQPAAIDRLFSSELERYPGYYGEMIWILMMAEQWLRRAAPSWRLG